MSYLPSLQALRAFEAAARHQSYSRAADELGLTHGAVSHRIRDLEERLGVVLVRRMAGRMVPTERANELLGQTRAALTILRQAYGVPPVAGRKRSRLIVSVLPAFATRWLVPRLASFQAVHPEVVFELVSEVSLATLRPDGADAAIRYGLGNWPGTDAQKLSDEQLFPVCSPDYAERLALETVQDLRRCMLLRHSWQPWAPWLHAVGTPGLEPGGPIYPDSALLLEAASAGHGVALARGLLVADALQQGQLVRPFSQSLPDTYAYYLVTPQQSHSADLESFRAWLAPLMKETARALRTAA